MGKNSVLGLQEFSFQKGPKSSHVSNSPGVSELWHNTSEISWFFVLCVFPLDLSGMTGRTGKIDNKWEFIGAQVEHKNLKRNKLLMLSCNS